MGFMALHELAVMAWALISGVYPAPVTQQMQTTCIAQAVYHEARGEPDTGQHAVAWVILNRVADPRWPDTPCEVVYQTHQFSWTRNNPPIREAEAFSAALEVALLAQQEWRALDDPWLWFYDPERADPRWARSLRVREQIGGHVFLSDW
jgi:spore germination cell wall hydrolase CwlJ-like protein